MTTGILLDTVLEITTGIGCRVACRFCPQSRVARAYRRRAGGSVHLTSFEVFASCVRKLPRHVDVDFSGFAEPWGNPECTRMLLFALERGHGLRIDTTLRGVTRADVDAFAAIPPARLDHVLGSLLESDFETVFYGAEWMRVQRAREDESLAVLCRSCEVWAYARSEPEAVPLAH